MRQRVRLFPTLTLALLAAACSDATNQQPTAPYGLIDVRGTYLDYVSEGKSFNVFETTEEGTS